MTAHPRAKEFAILERVCSSEQDRLLTDLQTDAWRSGNDKAVATLQDAQADQAWYDSDRIKLKKLLAELGIEPLAVLHRCHWGTIRDLYNLYELTLKNGRIRVEVPSHWVRSFEVATKWQNTGETKRFCKFTKTATSEAAVIDHKQLLKLFMPRNRSLPHNARPITVANAYFRVELPPAPEREQTVMEKLQQAGVPHNITADHSAIAFSPSVTEQMLGSNINTSERVREWKEFEPIVHVSEGDAVAIVGQWGQYVFEALAVQQAITAG